MAARDEYFVSAQEGSAARQTARATAADHSQGRCEGVKGARYCEALDAAGLSTPVSWQQNEGCLKTYPQAYWHQDPVERAKWRQRIANEKSKMTH